MYRWILHVDMDAFFASVEQYRNKPELVGKPVCVGPNPKGGTRRGVVRAASYEARGFGVKSGMPVSKAYRLCPDAVFVMGDFLDYVEASEEFMEILKLYSDGERVRRASIDEAYIEVTEGSETYGGPYELAKTLQSHIKNETLLPCSIGIAPNMSVAKIASDMRKPQGITLVSQEPKLVSQFLAPLRVEVLSGVGPKTASKLNSHGLHFLRQIQQLTVTELWPIMGRGSSWLRDRALGIDDRPLVDNGPRIRKSISKDRTFMNDVTPESTEYLRTSLTNLCKRISEKLSNKGLSFKTVTVKIRYDDFETIQRSKSLPVETNDTQILPKLALEIFEQKRDARKPIRQIGAKVSGLSENDSQCALTDFL